MSTAGCGDGRSTPISSATASTPASSSSGPASGTSGGTPAQTPSPGGSAYLPDPEPELTVPGKSGTGPTERLTGTVVKGTEGGCRMLSLGDGLGVQLIGGDHRLADGVRVTVEGRRAPGMATTCQQGTPFVISSIVSVG